jgi:hypothetical protein
MLWNGPTDRSGQAWPSLGEGRKVIIIISSIYINRNRETSLLPGTFGASGSRKKVTQKVAQISGQNVTQKLGPLWG